MEYCTDDEKQVLRKLITEYMVRHGCNQNKIAQLLSVTPTAVSCWLRPQSKTGISIKNALAIRKLCGENEDENELEQKRKMAENLEKDIIEQFKTRLINAIIDEKDVEPASLKIVLSTIRNTN